jgi:Tfp pilus assembly pilus retraction ATPase PilT
MTKMTSKPLPAHGLAGLMEAFALEQSGLIVFAGGPGSGRTTSAYAMAEHFLAAGRPVVAISTGPAVGTDVRHRPVSRRSDIPDAVRAEAAAGSAALLVDCDQDTDSLAAIVEAATSGSVMIATLNNRGTGSYTHLLNLVEAAEDWDGNLRRDFESSLYAVVTQALVETTTGTTLAAEIHPGRKLQK